MNNLKIFKYGSEEINYLCEKDPEICKFVKNIGNISRKINPDIFSSLIESVISQQISSKAADTVISRVYSAAGGKLTKESLKLLGEDNLQKCGLSHRKVSYIMGIVDSQIDFNSFSKLDDEEIISILTSLNGIGIWTAEMILIFSLNRKNVFSYGDLAIKRGLMKLHNLDTISKKEFLTYRELYSPYCSIASLYLWEISKL